jgi:putative transposase
VDENQIIVVENLAVKNMVKNHNLTKSVSDAGWGMFCTMLKYKAEAEGKVYLEVGRFFPSSHLCSETLLSLPKMDLSVREFNCARCGKRHDRDINAAINIKNVREAFPKGRLTDIGVGNQRYCPWRQCKTKTVWT